MREDSKTAPVVLFVYNRPRETSLTLTSLQNNFLAGSTTLYIFADGAKTEFDRPAVMKTRRLCRKVQGFREVFLYEEETNKGLAASVISGVSYVIKKHDAVIVVEDDLVVSENFLDFMNQALVFFRSRDEVMSISGYTLPLANMPRHRDFYAGYRASSWGWATWREVWEGIDWSTSGVEEYLAKRDNRKRFKRGGDDLVRMMRDYLKGNINSWAIRFCYHQHRADRVTIFPTVSKVQNIGFGAQATHTRDGKRFAVSLDTSLERHFFFDLDTTVSARIEKDTKYFFSLQTRIRSRVRVLLQKILEYWFP